MAGLKDSELGETGSRVLAVKVMVSGSGTQGGFMKIPAALHLA